MATMTLVEKHDFLKGSAEYKELDKLWFLSKNLYNAGLYMDVLTNSNFHKLLRFFEIYFFFGAKKK